MKKGIWVIVIILIIIAGGWGVNRFYKGESGGNNPTPQVPTPAPNPSPSPAPTPAPIITMGTLKAGETKTISGVALTLIHVLQDSRCPKDAVCVWVGNVVMNVTARKGANLLTFTEFDSNKEYFFDQYKIKVTNIIPDITSGSHVPAEANYRVTFKVSHI